MSAANMVKRRFVHLDIDRPLAFIDVETTGLNPYADRIVELSILKIHPDGTEEYKTHRINPGIPIPAEATSIHGITNEDVAGEPKFRQYAVSIRDFLTECDIAGFNVIKFDLSFLEAEFKRAGVEFSRKGRCLLDSQILYHQLEPRDLRAAYLKYCGKELENAHSAEGDAQAAAEILEGQLKKHPELPRNVDSLHAICNPGWAQSVDPEGKFIWSEGEAICTFGRYRGRSLKQIATDDPEYLEWIAASDFSAEVQEIARKAMIGDYPQPPELNP